MLRCQKLSGNTVITAQIDTQDMGAYADGTLQLNVIAALPELTIRNPFTQERIT